MTDQERFEEAAARLVEVSRQVFISTAETLEGKGVRLEDVCLGMAFAASDAAARLKGDHHGAIEWLRTAFDVQERQLLDRARAAN